MNSVYLRFLILEEENQSKERLQRRHIRDKSDSLSLTETRFQEYYRISKDAFLFLLNVFEENWPPRRKMFAVPTVVKLASILRFLAESSYHKEVGRQIDVGLAQSTFSEVLAEVLVNYQTLAARTWLPPKMDHQIKALDEYLTNMVAPSSRNKIDMNPEHITMLQGTKSKKQLSRKKKSNKSSALNRREYAKLGLHTLPTRQMKYEEALPLHRLWKGYMKEHLGLRKGDQVPNVFDAGYDAFSKLLVKTDLHGAKMYVMQSKCPTLVGLSGIVILDTKNVLKLLGKDNHLRTIPKAECIFGMKLGNMMFTIFGKHLCIRPAERSVKKIKNFIEPFE